MKHAWDWTEEHGGIILKQLRTLGCSCDWDRTAFTMDETRSKAVIDVFCDLYNKGLIYRGLRMVNWDPERQTALSDEEVIYQEEHSKLYYLKYYVVEPVGEEANAEGNVVHKDEKVYYAVVATTRPETIMGDVAMCINPKDPKNQWLKGKHVIVPKVGRVIPVIEDRYVEIEFGTGCLKVTPAHDVNDYALGQKYELTTYDIFTADAHVNVEGLEADIYPNVAADQAEVSCDHGLASNTRAGILNKASIQNRIGDRIRHLVGMAVGNALGSKQSLFHNQLSFLNIQRKALRAIRSAMVTFGILIFRFAAGFGTLWFSTGCRVSSGRSLHRS